MARTQEYKLLKIPQNAPNNAISRNKIQKNVLGRGTNPVGRETPLPTPIRTYGASILGFLAPTELDTRHPLSKILDPPLFVSSTKHQCEAIVFSRRFTFNLSRIIYSP